MMISCKLLVKCIVVIKMGFFSLAFTATRLARTRTRIARVPGPVYPGPGAVPGPGRVDLWGTRTDPSHTLIVLDASSAEILSIALQEKVK